MATSLSTDNYTSLIVEDQFPEFAKEEGPNLIAFVKAYYEYKNIMSNIESSKEILKEENDDEMIEMAKMELDAVSYTHLTLPTKRIV